MTLTKRRHRYDTLDQAMEHALRLGDYIDYSAAWSFITEHLGMFAETLFCGWIEARQAAHADSEETVGQPLRWMDKDDYGFCYQLEQEAVKVLNRDGLLQFASQVRKRFDAAKRPSKASNADGQWQRDASYRQRYWRSGVLETIYAAQRNLAAYVALREETELLPIDCEIIARMLQSRRKPEQALEWIERGLDLEKQHPRSEGSSYKLDEMKRKLLVKLGQPDKALESAWKEFVNFPCELSYDQFMKYVPKPERAIWHDKAMRTSNQGDLDFVIGLWLATKEIDRLTERLRRSNHQELESLSHYTMEPVGKKLARPHPDVAARVYRALGMRILGSGKSKYYDAALSHFAQARQCYRKAGEGQAWEALVEEILQKHRRKSAFMPGFEKLIQGEKSQAESAFAERTKRRKQSWNQ
ncbi:MAG: tetratricopeptide (TPR) repeat protein [Parasphingorhabdus sp.]|jgi:tetratricopeptide (TPR) repeat protein